MTAPTVVSIDGVLVPPEAATISVLDRGLLYGDGLFDVLRTHAGRRVDGARHVERMQASARTLGLTVPPLAPLLDAAIQAAGPGDHKVRVIATRGPIGATAGRTIIIVEPLPPQPTQLALAIVDLPLASRSGAGHKTLAYLDHLRAKELARLAGADEAVRLDAEGLVCEGATSNLFIVVDDAVLTPPVTTGALPGIVRARVLELWPVRVQPLEVADLLGADEIFATSSLRGVVPVTRLGTASLAVGPVTTKIMAAYDAWLRAPG